MLQFAQAVGANTFVTSGNLEKIKNASQLGALGGVNYHDSDWSGQLRALLEGKEFDLIVDSAGGSGFPTLIDLVRPGGKIIILGATAGNPPQLDIRRIFWKQVTIQGTTMGHPSDFKDMVKFVESKQLKPVLSAIYSSLDYWQAYEQMIEGKQFGKLVLKFGDD
jgi:NADPH:quinone reductase-like Zn-dependent oxidoreductase